MDLFSLLGLLSPTTDLVRMGYPPELTREKPDLLVGTIDQVALVASYPVARRLVVVFEVFHIFEMTPEVLASFDKLVIPSMDARAKAKKEFEEATRTFAKQKEEAEKAAVMNRLRRDAEEGEDVSQTLAPKKPSRTALTRAEALLIAALCEFVEATPEAA